VNKLNVVLHFTAMTADVVVANTPLTALSKENIMSNTLLVYCHDFDDQWK